MGKVKEYFIEKYGMVVLDEMGKMQAPPIERKKCLSTDAYFNKQWDEAELIVDKLKVALQYPAAGPDNLDCPETLGSIEAYKKWAKKLYCLSSDLADITEHLEVLGNDNGQIENNYLDTQRTSDPLELDGDRKHWEC